MFGILMMFAMLSVVFLSRGKSRHAKVFRLMMFIGILSDFLAYMYFYGMTQYKVGIVIGSFVIGMILFGFYVLSRMGLSIIRFGEIILNSLFAFITSMFILLFTMTSQIVFNGGYSVLVLLGYSVLGVLIIGGFLHISIKHYKSIAVICGMDDLFVSGEKYRVVLDLNTISLLNGKVLGEKQ